MQLKLKDYALTKLYDLLAMSSSLRCFLLNDTFTDTTLKIIFIS